MSDDQEKRNPLPHEQRIASAVRRIRSPRRRYRRWPLAGRHGSASTIHTRGMFSDLNAPSLQLGLADIPLAGQMQTEMREMRKLGRSNALATPIGSSIRNLFMRGVMGNGIEPVTDSKKLRVWREWASDPMQCDWYSRSTLEQILEQAISAWVADGEVFIRFHADGNGIIPLRLELIDSGRIPTYKFEGSTAGLPDDMGVEQGIVLTTDWKVQGYALSKRQHLSNAITQTTYNTGRAEFVPVSEMSHIFEIQSPDQLRGISRLIPCAANIDHLTEFSEMALKSARLGARHYAAISDPAYTIPDDEDLEDAEPDYSPEEFIGNIDGELIVVRVGDDAEFKPIPSDYPSTVFHPFVDSQLRQIASSVGIPHHILASDLGGISYSAGKIGQVQFTKELESIRSMFAHLLLRRVWRKMLGYGESFGLFSVNFEREKNVQWSPLFQQDPELSKTAAAYEKLVNMGVVSKATVMRKLGYDPVQMQKEIDSEMPDQPEPQPEDDGDAA